MSDPTPDQLEFFEQGRTLAPKVRHLSSGRMLLQCRYDQLVLMGIAALIGLTLVFAAGVERGKTLVRTERPIWVKRAAVIDVAQTVGATPQADTVRSAHPEVDATQRATTAPVQTPRRDMPGLAPDQLLRERSRYAVQVVTYRTVQVARQELKRLQARGERGFLVKRGKYTVVYVGPFPSKGNAHQKVAGLRQRYQDCFVKTL